VPCLQGVVCCFPLQPRAAAFLREGGLPQGQQGCFPAQMVPAAAERGLLPRSGACGTGAAMARQKSRIPSPQKERSAVTRFRSTARDGGGAAYDDAKSPSKRFLPEGAPRSRSQRRVSGCATRFRPHSRSSLCGAYLHAGGGAVTRELSPFDPSSRRAGAARAGSKPKCFGLPRVRDRRSPQLLLKQ
jgi:hypothetical protein